jgi:3'-phosphoadenosine 5'-phosphosulfate sulfotransferase (PAPS reductase)/FAD synthetase
VLLVTGERRQESGMRAKDATVERHSGTTKKRRVDQFRAVIDCREEQVWEMMRLAGIVPHPCYYLGFSRASCMTCIFLQNEEWSTVQALVPTQFEVIARMEELFGSAISMQGMKKNVRVQADSAPSMARHDPYWSALGTSHRYEAQGKPGPILVEPDEWILPMGAFRGGHGPG